jgi:hypothetical protein
MIIAVDFDGTCVSHAYPHMGEALPHAVEVLKELVAAGHKLILWTCREDHPVRPECQYLAAAVRWFEKNDIPLVGINETPTEYEFRDDEFMDLAEARAYRQQKRKVHADIYIDDRNLGGFPGWLAVREALLCA